ncbi:MAG: MerR family transcriptional regulator [Myxococcales bacterium]|nr:MerR family transcriptional regulator [Myxococcales bacterium]
MTELPDDDIDRVKMSVLARRSGVPAATIKHYVREGLLPEPYRTSRNMAYYDASLVPRIQAIKELQRSRFLPLKVIKEILDQAEDTGLDVTDVMRRVLDRHAGEEEFRTRASLVEAGVPEKQLAFFEGLGLVKAEERDGVRGYSGDDLALLRILGASRRAGITPEMLPHTILEPYVRAIHTLASLELDLFEQGVGPHAKGDLPQLVEVASELSEQLVIVLRRKMLQSILASRRDAPAKPTRASKAKASVNGRENR